MLKNIAKNRIMVSKVKIYDNIFLKGLGLMFSRPLNDKCLVLRFKSEKIRPLHMYFVFYAIDVLFLDKDSRVVEIKENFKPFSFYFPKNKAMFIVEVPLGTAKKARVEIGDAVDFENSDGARFSNKVPGED